MANERFYPTNFESKVGFDEVRTLLRGRCLSRLGTDVIDGLHFMTDIDAIRQRLAEVTEMAQVLDHDDTPPVENVTDMRPALLHLRVRGTHLEETELFALLNSLRTVSALIEFLRTEEDEKPLYPALRALSDGVESFPMICNAIAAILDKFGRIKDDASPELRRIRAEQASVKRGITISLHRILSRAQLSGVVEKDVSPALRDGRLVIPVLPAKKRQIRGIVHDESASGKTVFIEPAEVVEGNNRVRELEIEERRAILQILQDTAEAIRPHTPQLLQTFAFLGQVDAIRAKAIYAEATESTVPHLENRPMMDLIEARHPLLEALLRRHGRKMNPLDLMLCAEARVLLISGPNAGGKSVCLKTAGLLQYMLQCGLPIPVRPNSTAGLFGSIFIDIGDEQSLENDLSTYSSHLLNMKVMLKQSSHDSLILIDEFGSGTEPQIGGAIAMSVLRRLVDKGVWGIITTHYQSLKDFAANHQGIANGAMLYDRQQMMPLFQLRVGNPGSSFAIEIARKTGLPEDVIDEAAKLVGEDYIQSDKYLQDIVRDKRYWENKRQEVHRREKQLDEIISRYERDVKSLAEKRKDVLGEAREQAEQLLRESNARIEGAIREIREAQAEKERTKEIRQQLQEFREQMEPDGDAEIDKKMAQIAQRKERREKRKLERSKQAVGHANPSKNADNAVLAVGGYARIKGQTTLARIVRIKGSTAVVESGSIQVSVKLERLEPAQAPKPEAATTSDGYGFIGRQTTEQIHQRKLAFKHDIDVRGQRGDEALQTVQAFIDDAILLGENHLRILHGTGSGYLRQVIRQYLHTVPDVMSYHDERVQLGGAGITVIKMK